MTKDTEALIVEMGMRGLGEIELISTHLEPDYAIITNSGSAHVGRLGSLDNIAIAKCEITSGLKQNGTFIALNQDIIKNTSILAAKKFITQLKMLIFWTHQNLTLNLNIKVIFTNLMLKVNII